jgi:hypothetical protein
MPEQRAKAMTLNVLDGKVTSKDQTLEARPAYKAANKK